MGGATQLKRLSVVLVLCTLLAFVALAFAIVARDQGEAEAAFPGANGKIAFISIRNGDVDIYSMNDDGSNVTQLTSGFDFNFAPVWSADGTKIAFLHLGFDPSQSDIYSMNADGSGLTNVTNGAGGLLGELTWSPDGSKIAFQDTSDIYVINTDGTGLTNLTNNVGSDESPAWSPDGLTIAYENGGDIFVMNANGTGQTNLTGAGSGTRPDWSPDGLTISYESGGDIFVMNANGTGQTNLTNSGAIEFGPVWSPDGTKITYYSLGEVYIINANGTGVTNPTNGDGGESPNWQPLPEFPNSNVDLVIKQMKIELETAGFCGFTSTTLGVTIIISNTGSAAAASFVVEVNSVQQTVSGGLAAASQTSLWFTGDQKGHPSSATVDVLNQVQETNESNNTNTKTLPLPTLPPTCTPEPTPTPTPTPTPKPPDGDTDGDTIPNSVDEDDDNDSCTDVQENGLDETLGGLRNPHNPHDFYDVLGPGAALPKDKVIDLPNDILGVIQHFSPAGAPPYDVQFDRGPSSGPNPWNMTAPDGVIDLPNDILGVIQQFDHDCR